MKSSKLVGKVSGLDSVKLFCGFGMHLCLHGLWGVKESLKTE